MTVRTRTLHEGWTVRAGAGRRVPDAVREAGAIPAAVPGSVTTDLLAAGLIDDPFLDDNERLQAWVGATDFVFDLDFEWQDEGDERVDLVFDGLDTVATVRVNGEQVLSSRNQHRSYRVPVRHLLRVGANSLRVEFTAPVPAAGRAEQELGARPHVNHHPYNAIRKMASGFGWDWGIDTATSGIWRPVRLESWSGARLDAVRPVVSTDGPDGLLDVHVRIERADERPVRVTVRIAGVEEAVDVAGAEAVVSVRVPDVRRWWPRGFGEPHRYPLTVELTGDIGVRDERALNIGFRDVRIDTTPDEAGTPLRILVNERLVYVRGANWIPDDAFPHRVDRARYERRIRQAESANVNLLRVWGGGIYESEDFYDLCDERGMLTWQDFLLACAAYAEEEPLRSEIEAEAREAVTRLAAHPSLVVLNGNNENLEGFEEWGWPARLDGATWGAHYYHELFPALVAELAPHIAYTPGSPFTPGGVSRPNDPDHGSVHIWDLWNRRDWPDYREYRPRFVAEFGWQGPPTWATLTRAIHDDPLSPVSPGMQVHQKAIDGDAKLTSGLVAHTPVPRDMRDWVWAMQLNQARAVGTALEHFRSLAPHNAGAIVWQLNDDWPVVSWAAVDGDGREKPLLYAMAHAFADRLVTIQPRDGGLAVILGNETEEAWRGTLEIERLASDGTVLASQAGQVDVAPRGTVTVALAADVATAAHPADELVRARLGGEDAWWFFADLRDALLEPARLDLSVTAADGGVRVEATAATLVRDLALLVDTVAPDAVVDDALVHLLPGEKVVFHVTTAQQVGADAFTAVGVVRTGNDLVAGAPELRVAEPALAEGRA
ncbi:glycoside hydrolase family 2 protein [Microbacterium paludicola]|uniref:beta-mannosidase n=1 Tax=Microbacterium paludicola TaxID=300019 RepID=A0A4Y9FWW4_9MICO|nr:glycoside hydrolase family 2 protein [Microbacterium paludicola]MBF0815672.1 glycoside hydrolase family 2 protein [Microbacterium paludicola]TFU33719.1 glycoside hydrolase family 2 protein [Microbacterium paludicola]